jgi:hypothetical protein
VVKHLAVLSRAGLVSASRQGREVRYLIRPDSMAATARWTAGLAAGWDRRLAKIKHIAESLSGAAGGRASSGQAGELLLGGNDPDAERDQRDRDDLVAGQPERDAYDRQA